MLFRPVQLLPPGAEATARVAHAKVRVQHNAVHTIVRAFEKVSVVLAQCVWHPVTLPHPQRSRKNNGDGRRVSTSCVCCPARGPFFRAKSRKKPRSLDGLEARGEPSFGRVRGGGLVHRTVSTLYYFVFSGDASVEPG